MEAVQFTSIHWAYVIGVLAVLATMLLRKNVLIPCLVFTFIVGFMYNGGIPAAVSTVFTASVVAAKNLFSIFFIIAIMVTLLKALKVTRSDEMLAKPMQGFMRSPLSAYISIVLGTVFFSLLFWPTPAIPLVGALLIPAAIRAGLHPMVAAIALALAGQGMSLAGDVIIQGAPGLTAKAAGVPIEMITLKGGILTVITGAVAIPLGYFVNRKEIKEFYEDDTKNIEDYLPVLANNEDEDIDPKNEKYNKFGAIFLIVVVLSVIYSMFAFDIKGGDAAGLLGGAALFIIAVMTLLTFQLDGLDKISDFLGEGLAFAFKVMGPIIPIAGFFFLGSPETAPAILGEDAPGYLFDIGKYFASIISPTGIVASFGILILGMVTGLDGSGFSGLPVVGTLAAALASGQGAGTVSTLASIGQMGSIWAGGGTLVAWSSLVAVAGIVGVPVLDLVRKNFIPVMSGLIVSTLFALLFL